jgi:hypothetical protein
MDRQPISAAAPETQVLREAKRADTVEERFREVLQPHGLDGEWHIIYHTDLAELAELPRRPIWRSSGNIRAMTRTA